MIFLSCFTVDAANVYILDGGSGDGSSWTSPLDDLPSTLIRGNTYYFGDGSYAGRDFDEATDGLTYIYLKKAIVADHGTATGWNDAYGDGAATFTGQLKFRTDYWDLDGQVGGGPNNWRTGHGFIVDPTSSSSDCIHLDAPGTFQGAVNYVHVRHCELVGSGRDTGEMNCIEQTWGGSGIFSENCTLEYSWLHDSSRSLVKTRHPKNWVLQYNHIERNRSSAAKHSEGWSNHGGEDVTVKYNRWCDIEGTGVIVTLDGISDNWQIYGNIFYIQDGNPNSVGSNGNGTIVTSTGSNGGQFHNSEFHNNTFWNLANQGGKSGVLFDGNGSTGNIAQNNLLVDCEDVFWGYVTREYNTHHNCDVRSSISGTGNLDVATADPLNNPESESFYLTVATAAGNSLSSPFNLDMWGNTRGGDGTFDRGAFEYPSVVDGEDPTAPDALTGSAINSSTIDIHWNAATDNTGVTGYKIYRDDVEIDTTTALTYTDTGLSADTAYDYQVSAYDGASNEGPKSNEVTITTPAAAELDLHYTFEDGSGSSVTDSSGNSRTGTISGSTWNGSGKVGSDSLRFDGNNDYVNAGTWDAASDVMSIAAWCYLESWDGTYPRVICKGNGTASSAQWWMLGADDANNYPSGASDTHPIKFRLKLSGTTQELAAGEMPLNQWVHLVATYDGAWMRLYKDGVEIGASSQTGTISKNSGISVWVGNNPPTSSSRPWDGLIDDLRVYTYALNQAQIDALVGVVPDAATSPTPADAATGVVVSQTLSWSAGSGATSHDVYFSTNTAALQFQGNQAGTTFSPELATSTTYYWRVDEVNATGTTAGTKWSFTTENTPESLPTAASNPSPSDTNSNVHPLDALVWTRPGDAVSASLYFGATSSLTSNDFVENMTVSSYQMWQLLINYNTTYYWRIDTVNEAGVTEGTTWSFTTMPAPTQASGSTRNNIRARGRLFIELQIGD